MSGGHFEPSAFTDFEIEASKRLQECDTITFDPSRKRIEDIMLEYMPYTKKIIIPKTVEKIDMDFFYYADGKIIEFEGDQIEFYTDHLFSKTRARATGTMKEVIVPENFGCGLLQTKSVRFKRKKCI